MEKFDVEKAREFLLDYKDWDEEKAADCAIWLERSLAEIERLRESKEFQKRMMMAEAADVIRRLEARIAELGAENKSIRDELTTAYMLGYEKAREEK